MKLLPIFRPSPDKVDADFTLEVEVYCSLPPEEPTTHSKPSTPIKMLKRLRGNKVDTTDCVMCSSGECVQLRIGSL